MLVLHFERNLHYFYLLVDFKYLIPQKSLTALDTSPSPENMKTVYAIIVINKENQENDLLVVILPSQLLTAVLILIFCAFHFFLFDLLST